MINKKGDNYKEKSRFFTIGSYLVHNLMMLKLLLSLLLSVYSFSSLACEKVIFGDLDWDSSRFHVGVASFIVKNGYGCEVDRIPGIWTGAVQKVEASDTRSVSRGGGRDGCGPLPVV